MNFFCLELQNFQWANQFAYILAIVMSKFCKLNMVQITNEDLLFEEIVSTILFHLRGHEHNLI